MKRIFAALLALALAGRVDARALIVVTNPNSANNVTGVNRISEVGFGMLNTLGGDYRAKNILDFRSGDSLVSQTIRSGNDYPGPAGTGAPDTYGLIIIFGDDLGSYTGTTGANCTIAPAVGGYAYIRSSLANCFQWYKPGMLVSGTGITGLATIVSVDSLYQRMTVAGTVPGTGTATINVTWQTPLRPDSLTLTADATNGRHYPKVPVLRIGQFMNAGALTTTAGRCSTGVGALQTYAQHQDSTVNLYEVGNPYRSWKARNAHVVNGTRDPRGWRPILARVSTRQNNPGLSDGNFDFPDASLGAWATYKTDPDSVALWVVQNRDAAGGKIGGDAAPNIYCAPAQLFGTNSLDPGTLLAAFALADSLSGGALFGSSTKLPRQMGFHIDDGWKRGDSRFAGSYGGIGVNDTTALKASIDSLAELGIPVVVGVECDTLNSVLLRQTVVNPINWSGTSMVSAGGFGDVEVGDYVDGPGADISLGGVTVVAKISTSLLTLSASGSQTGWPYTFWKTGNGRYYDQRWWARAPLVHYTPHCHAGLISGTNRAQNNATKYLRPLDLWGLTRTRYAFGSVDSLLAYGLTDYVNDPADSAATYWLSKRAKAMCDSVFGPSKVDGLVMPPGDDWTNFQIKHTRARQHGLGVDSVMASAVMSGMTGIRMNARGNVVGNDDSTTTNNYGWWVTSRRMTLADRAGGAGLPAWASAAYYGRPCNMVTTDGYPGSPGQGSSVWSWSQQRATYSGEKFLMGLLAGHVDLATDPTTYGREVYVLAAHASDFGSSGRYTNNEATRPMFYTFKYVTNAVRVANAHARRPLVRFVYPQEIQP